MKDILEHIEKVRAEMFKENIKANTIIIDKEVAKVNGFPYISVLDTITKMPPMFMGLEVHYENNISEIFDTPCNFVMFERKRVEPPKTPLSEYSTDELLDEIRKRML